MSSSGARAVEPRVPRVRFAVARVPIPPAVVACASVLAVTVGCSRVEPAPPSLEAAELVVPAFDSVRLSLVDGVGAVRDADGTLVVEGGVTEWRAIGDFDADGALDAVVVVWSSGGGTGTFMDLALFAERPGERSRPAAWVWRSSEPLGDRVRVRALTVEGDRIELRVTRHAPDDPMCCPTERAALRFRLAAGALVHLGDAAEDRGEAGAAIPGPEPTAGA